MAKGEATRRERLRQATYAEIVDTARAALANGEPISLRAVAAAMGMAPSALYRYVDSLDDLQRLVANRVYDELLAQVQKAAERYDDPQAQIIAGLCAFRAWALAHRPEFQLVFATGSSGLGLGAQQPEDLDRYSGLVAFSGYLMQLVVQARAQGLIAEPPPFDQLSRRAQHALKQQQKMWGDEPRLPQLALEAWWVQYVSWTRIVGVIIMEVTDQLPAPLVATGALFEETLISFTEQYAGPTTARLHQVLQTELDRRPE